MARRLIARFATFWRGLSCSSIAKRSSSSLDSRARFLVPFVEVPDRVERLGAGFSESASLVAGVDLNDCSVVLNGTESTVLEGEERVFLRRGGIAMVREAREGGKQFNSDTKANK
jgi:hypothetical protein